MQHCGSSEGEPPTLYAQWRGPEGSGAAIARAVKKTSNTALQIIYTTPELLPRTLEGQCIQQATLL